MTVRNLSPAQQSYIWAVARFSWFFRKSRTELGMEQVRAYQLELIRRGLSYPHIKQVSAALRFVFGVTLERPEAFERIVVAKTPKKLPIVLSCDEVLRLLHAADGLRNKVTLATAGACPRAGRRPDPWGTGLCAAELAALTVTAPAQCKVMTLTAEGFIRRRFLLHVLPDGFHRIRHYGFLANGNRAANLARCRQLLAVPPTQPPAATVDNPQPSDPATCHPLHTCPG